MALKKMFLVDESRARTEQVREPDDEVRGRWLLSLAGRRPSHARGRHVVAAVSPASTQASLVTTLLPNPRVRGGTNRDRSNRR